MDPKPASGTLDAAVCALLEDQARLKRRLQELQQLHKEARDTPKLKVPFPVPEVPLEFRGRTEQGREAAGSSVSQLRICCPLPGGSVLVTFDDPKVAEQVLQRELHQVNLEECRLRVRVRPLELPMVTAVQVSSGARRERVLVSGLPVGLALPEDTLLDKLELFFSKARHGGGDVDTLAQRLCQVGQFQVPLGGQQVPLRVTPYMSGDIQKAEVSTLLCRLPRSPVLLPCTVLPQPPPEAPIPPQIQWQAVPRSVLVLGVPDVLDGPELRDILEVHFQKPTCGGGEVAAVAVVPPGQRGLAVFTSASGRGREQ
ncbi:interferon-induced 35 kDa protein isoform X2 [Heterocephalus glaber]|uniref:Interferon-induced 35 kDa protein isoform X2 n=1 Tax=Heterocephalus glaber TaxID=10181 RepID=A0AAX6PTQ0_HETGA|nr:interferon-induced 35 kDa protein isoform X2 [Heterocephalus glaber]